MAEETHQAASRIFISYRREDAAGYVRALFRPLSDHFGEERIFKDTDNIPPGVDFVKAINRELESCSVLLAIIGREWMTAQDSKSKTRRLDNPRDYLRLEIATALTKTNVLVIPVLVGRATMPSSEDLPPDLEPLSRRNALELSEANQGRWDADVNLLIRTVEKAIPHPRPIVRWLVSAGLVAVVILGGGYLTKTWRGGMVPVRPTVTTPDPNAPSIASNDAPKDVAPPSPPTSKPVSKPAATTPTSAKDVEPPSSSPSTGKPEPQAGPVATNPNPPKDVPPPPSTKKPDGPVVPSGRSVQVDSNPAGATIALDDIVQRQTTPSPITVSGAGPHWLRLSKAGYQSKAVKLTAADVQKGSMTLTLVAVVAETTAVSLTGPYQFQVFDGARLISGASNSHHLNVAAGKTLRLVAPEYLLDLPIRVDGAPVRAPALGKLDVIAPTSLGNCPVRINGIDLMEYPNSGGREVAEGRYSVELVCPDGQKRGVSVVVFPGQSTPAKIFK